jgi:uncharacterized protein YbjT (DUF2867 family)
MSAEEFSGAPRVVGSSGRRRCGKLAIVRGQGRSRVLRDVGTQPPCGGSDGGSRPPRRVVVGTDRLLASGYFRGKMAQENLIRASPIPYTIVRATQSFEFVRGIAHASADGQTIRLTTALLQPIASGDVAQAVCDAALAEPVNGIVEVAGPNKIGLDELVRRFLKAINDPGEVASDPKALYFGAELNDQSLTPGERARIAATHFDNWLTTLAEK